MNVFSRRRRCCSLQIQKRLLQRIQCKFLVNRNLTILNSIKKRSHPPYLHPRHPQLEAGGACAPGGLNSLIRIMGGSHWSRWPLRERTATPGENGIASKYNRTEKVGAACSPLRTPKCGNNSDVVRLRLPQASGPQQGASFQAVIRVLDI
jgi:hypothetical protein